MYLQHNRVGGLRWLPITLRPTPPFREEHRGELLWFEKDEEIGSSRKIQGKKRKAPTDDLDGKVLESGGIIRQSPGIHLIDKKWALRDEIDSEYYSEANFRHGGRKRKETITPTNIGVSLRGDFFL